MQLWEEAEKTSIFGLEVYTFGLFAAAGAILAAVAICLFCRKKGLKAGTGLFTVLLSLLLGAVCSRVAFCLLNQELGYMMPLFSWTWITGGGWSMMGLVGGVLLAGFLSARILREETGTVMDACCLGLPLFMCLERIGEHCIPAFDLSRGLETEWLARSFLAVGDEYDAWLTTWKLAAAYSLVLFGILLWRARKPERPGNLCVRFLILFGAGSIILESLRYDFFLSLSFVGLQHVAALIILCAGVIAAVIRAKDAPVSLKRAALIALPLAGGIALALEFALDRTTMNKFLIYAIMIIAVFTPAVLGLRLLDAGGKGRARR